MGKIYFTRKLTQYNSFSENGEYGENWVSISLNRSRYIMPETKFLYGCIIGRKVDFWEYRVMDYINYNLMYDRNVIFVGSKRLYKKALKKYGDHSIYDRKLRPYENRYVVHSTTTENYQNIKKQGCIKSWNILKKEIPDFETQPIGAMLGDPEDFRDYIMLGSGVQCEIVVLSKQKNQLCHDADEEYTPGARIYFDNKILAEKGLLVRDGIHYKVKNELPLSLALFIATVDNIKINGKVTPNIFAEAADIKFSEHVSMT